MFKATTSLPGIAARALLVVSILWLASCGGGAGEPGNSAASAPLSGGTSVASEVSTPSSPVSGSDPATGASTEVGSIDPGGVGSGGTGQTADGLSVGSISGFGSVIVNDVRYVIDSITPQIEDAAALALGMTVQIRGPVDATGLEGTATSLVSAAEVRGKVTNIDMLTHKLWVHNFPVEVDLGTVFVGTGLLQLAIGDEVQIHGLPSSGMLLATRVEKLAYAGLPILTGAVSALDTTKMSFDLGGVQILYSGAALSGFGPTHLADGTIVRVRSSSLPVNNVLQAAKVQRWISVPDAGTSSLTITGGIENFSSVSNTFSVAGVTVDASKAVLKADVLKALQNGTYIKATGIYSDGVLTAQTVKIVKIKGTPPMPSYSLAGPVQNYVSASDFKVQGQRVDASASTVVFSKGAAPKLGQTPPPKVKIVGTRLINGILIADTVQF
jgi:hypothetical protein